MSESAFSPPWEIPDRKISRDDEEPNPTALSTFQRLHLRSRTVPEEGWKDRRDQNKKEKVCFETVSLLWWHKQDQNTSSINRHFNMGRASFRRVPPVNTTGNGLAEGGCLMQSGNSWSRTHTNNQNWLSMLCLYIYICAHVCTHTHTHQWKQGCRLERGTRVGFNGG